MNYSFTKKKAMELVGQFTQVQFEWIKRDKNERADAIAFAASQGQQIANQEGPLFLSFPLSFYPLSLFLSLLYLILFSVQKGSPLLAFAF